MIVILVYYCHLPFSQKKSSSSTLSGLHIIHLHFLPFFPDSTGKQRKNTEFNCEMSSSWPFSTEAGWLAIAVGGFMQSTISHSFVWDSVSFYGPLKKESPPKTNQHKGDPSFEDLKILRFGNSFGILLEEFHALFFLLLGGGCWFVGLLVCWFGGVVFRAGNFGQHDDLETQEEKDAGSPATVPPQAG